jgi:transposase
VLVMDNASFHHSDWVKEMCIDAGVKLMYLPPYSPDLNPIKEFWRSSRPLSSATGGRTKRTQRKGLMCF